MEKDCDRRKETGNGGRGWSEGRTKYACADEAGVDVASRASKQGYFVDRFGNRD